MNLNCFVGGGGAGGDGAGAGAVAFGRTFGGGGRIFASQQEKIEQVRLVLVVQEQFHLSFNFAGSCNLFATTPHMSSSF